MHDTTRSLARRSAMGLALVALLAAPAGAQNHRFALGVGGGWSQPADLTPGLASSTTLEPGWIAGLQIEAWPGSGQVGLRLGGTYMDRALEEDPAAQYGVYSADLSLLVRVLPAGRVRWVAPYLAVGAGASMYQAAEGGQSLGGGVYGDDPVTRAVALAGGGFDLLPSKRFGLRLEAVDRIVLPSIGEGPDADGLPTSQGPQVMAALQLRGLPINEVPRVIAAQQPAPAPAATRTAAAAPAPAAQARPAVDAEVKARIDDSQRRITILTERVDSLETAVQRAERMAAEAASAAAARPVAVQAAAVQPAPKPAASRAAAASGPLFTVQVGAFVEEETARLWAERLRRRNVPVFVTPAVVRGMHVSRVRVGALPSAAEADGLAQMLKREYGWPVWVDRVSADAVVTADIVDATRSFLGSN